VTSWVRSPATEVRPLTTVRVSGIGFFLSLRPCFSLQSEVLIHELRSSTAVDHAGALYLAVDQASEDDRRLRA
jgi:hypothetical protein